MRKINFSITVAFAVLILSSCSKHSNFEATIADKIKNSCKENSECTINVKDLTDFNWDKMFVFKYNASLEDVNKVVGANAGKYTEFMRRIIFTLNNKVVFNEEQPTNIEGLTEGEIVFDIPDSLTYKSYDVNTAIFLSRTRESNSTTYYELTQVHK
jgi:hypothetical protein